MFHEKVVAQVAAVGEGGGGADRRRSLGQIARHRNAIAQQHVVQVVVDVVFADGQAGRTVETGHVAQAEVPAAPVPADVTGHRAGKDEGGGTHVDRSGDAGAHAGGHRPPVGQGTRTPIPSEPETLSDPPARTQLTGRSSSTAVSVPSKYAYPVNADTHYI